MRRPRTSSAQFDGNMFPKMTAAFSSAPCREGNGGVLEQLGILPARLLRRPRRQDRHAGRELQGRELQRHHVPVLRRRLPLVRHQRVRRAQRDVDRLVRLAAPHRRQPAERAVDGDLQQPSGAAVQVRGDLRPRVPAPARVLGEPGEATWANEGLADYAITVTGYGFPARSIFETGCEGHIQTFLGWRRCRRRRTRSRSRRAVRRTRSRSGTTRAGSRRSPTTAPRGRSWSSSPGATARPS